MPDRGEDIFSGLQPIFGRSHDPMPLDAAGLETTGSGAEVSRSVNIDRENDAWWRLNAGGQPTWKP
ncbi:hypothetical protein [Sulfuritalea sp.]|uniref:hypothetical protein n=1 Tax=Sulfuritalea sp. TaxID=2480090 RepID=UPI00286DB523|nr:hypothetical protein [Sulfuritalea sp.]